MLDDKLQNGDFQNLDLHQMLATCLGKADTLLMPVVAIKICEAMELLDDAHVRREDS